jgi:hypothetical protein
MMGSAGALVFTVAASVAALSASLSQWYAVNFPLAGSPSNLIAAAHGQFNLTSPGYGGWRYVVPITAALAVLVGLLGVSLRMHSTWSNSYGWLVRLCVLGVLALCVAAMIASQPDVVSTPRGQAYVLSELHADGVSFGLGWWAWFGTASALAAVVSSLMI